MKQKEDYLNAVWNIIDELKSDRAAYPKKYIFSDIEDDEGNQYVDLVQEGGGMLGIALAGYTHVMESMGIRFLSLAGTSAGAINTLLMASLKKPNEAKSERILEILTTTNFYNFVDGGWDAKLLIDAFLKGEDNLTKFFAFSQNWSELRDALGLNPGKAFKDWLDDQISHKTTESLLYNMRDLPNLYFMDRSKRKEPNKEPKVSDTLKIKESVKLAIISADITTQTKACFPEMAELYYLNPQQVNPVDFARASMSIPVFFEPHVVSLTEIDRNDDAYRKIWKEKAGFTGVVPEKIVFVDGGVMSNFPIDAIFSMDDIGHRPVFGVKLGVDREKANDISGIGGLLLDCFNSSRNLRDFEFLFNDPTFKDLITYVNTGDHNWIDFNLSDDAKLDLFVRGAEAASRFLRSFDWESYKLDRKKEFLHNIRSKHSWLLHYNDVIRKFDLGDECEKKLEKLKKAGFKVLWIDDDYTNDSLEITVLERLFINITPVSSSSEAWEWLDKEKFDLIISDSNRENNPDEGITFAHELLNNEKHKDIPIILHSITARKNADMWQRLPQNIVNRDGKRDVLILKELVLETVRVLCGK